MAKLVNYTCIGCGEDVEEIFNDTEDYPEELEEKCPKCGDVLRTNNIKNNCHRWNYLDRGGM